MTIKIIPQKGKPPLLPKDFEMGKIYQCTREPNYLVLGTRTMAVVDSCSQQSVRGVGLDNTATPWFEGDTGRQFTEVEITVTVGG